MFLSRSPRLKLNIQGIFALILGASLWCLFSADTYAQRFNKVVIDPGHGGEDPGSSHFGVSEKALTLDLAKRIKKVLDEKKVVQTVLTRDQDTYLTLAERAEKANDSSDTIFVSVHFNAHSDRSITGIETFYYPGSEQGKVLGHYVQSELSRRIATRNRGVKARADLKVLNSTKGPAILIECGFISNRWEAQRSASAWFRQVLAEEIAQGILRYR